MHCQGQVALWYAGLERVWCAAKPKQVVQGPILEMPALAGLFVRKTVYPETHDSMQHATAPIAAPMTCVATRLFMGRVCQWHTPGVCERPALA